MRRASLRILIPVALIALGVWLESGCIPIPSTYQYQSNGAHRPEHFVGTGANDPVRIGYTHIEDAMIELAAHEPRVGDARWSMPNVLVSFWNAPIARWDVDEGGRRFALHYNLHTGTTVAPLCFFISWPEIESRWLVLSVNEQRVIIDAKTTRRNPMPKTSPARWLQIFDEPTRAKLNDARILPSDIRLRQPASATTQPHKSRWPATTQRRTGD